MARRTKIAAHPHIDRNFESGEGYLAASVQARECLRQTVAAAGRGRFAMFGYGSLMWNPGFKAVFVEPALLRGWRRSGCIRSSVYRGTRRKPGLVFGLDAGGSCRGVALGLPAIGRARIIRMLFGREMFQGVYEPRMTSCTTARIGRVRCLAFVADRGSRAYAGRLSPEVAGEMVRTARGTRGTCRKYWRMSCARMREFGIDWDPGFEI